MSTPKDGIDWLEVTRKMSAMDERQRQAFRERLRRRGHLPKTPLILQAADSVAQSNGRCCRGFYDNNHTVTCTNREATA